MKRLTIGLFVLIIAFAMSTDVLGAVSEDFEDGDYTNDPAWWLYNDRGDDSITADPIRTDNLVWMAYGGGRSHHMLRTDVSGIQWSQLDVSFEYKASASGNFHAAWFGTIDQGLSTIGLWYDPVEHDSDVRLYILQEYGAAADFTYEYIPVTNIPRDQWLTLHTWYDSVAELIRLEVRNQLTGVLIEQVSSQPALEVSQLGELDFFDIGIEEVEWQYIDNINLTPEPSTIILLVLGGFLFLKRNR